MSETYKSLTEAMQSFDAVDANAAPVFQIDDNWDEVELENGANELRRLMLMLDEDINRIKTQLDFFSMQRPREKRQADPSWWPRANSALRHKSREKNNYQNMLGIVNRRIRQHVVAHNIKNAAKASNSDALRFVQCAKRLLTGEQYQKIWDEARMVQK